MATPGVVQVPLCDITIDSDIQPRANGNDPGIVEEYAAAMKSHTTFPPVRVFDDGQTKWLSQGFHRYAARREAGFKDIDCEIVKGAKLDAILDAVGSNATHGLRRSNADKRRAVAMLLRQEKWAGRSDRWIASKCGVSHPTVKSVRDELENFSSSQKWRTSNGQGVSAGESNGKETRQGLDGKTRRLPESAQTNSASVDDELRDVTNREVPEECANPRWDGSPIRSEVSHETEWPSSCTRQVDDIMDKLKSAAQSLSPDDRRYLVSRLRSFTACIESESCDNELEPT